MTGLPRHGQVAASSDSEGNLAFRVDNYGDGFWRRSACSSCFAHGCCRNASSHHSKKKLITLEEQWLIYQGEENTNPKYQVIKYQHICKNNTVAHITHCSDHEEGHSGGGRRRRKWGYQIEGSYGHWSCTFRDERRQQVAEIKRKDDVFRLVVRPEFDRAAAMTVVMVLEEVQI